MKGFLITLMLYVLAWALLDMRDHVDLQASKSLLTIGAFMIASLATDFERRR